jgi:hypothetical protein
MLLKTRSAAVALLIGALSTAIASDIPGEKLALIQKAMEVMRVKSRMDGFIGKIVSAKVKRIQKDNPGVSDSMMMEIQTVINGVYRENLDGVEGLYPKLYQVVDKYLSDDDLKFVMNYNASDGGQRYSKVAPRVIQESGEIERKWSNKLEPVIMERLKDKFKGANLNFGSM